MFKINLKETLQNYKRILMVTSKPSKDDYFDSAKITAIGISIVGIIGLIVYMVAVLTGI